MSSSETTPRIRVLVTGPSLQGPGAGIQQHVRSLSEAFSGSGTFEVVPFSVTSVRYRESWLLKAARLVSVCARFPSAARGCDLIHVNSTIDRRSIIRDAILVALASLSRRPVVVQFHGGGIHRLHGASGAFAIRIGRLIRRASAVLFLSRTQGEPLAAELGFGKVEYVGNYVDVSCFSAVRSGSDPELHIAYLGRLDAEKGVGEVVEAVLSAGDRDWRLRVAGAGPLEPVVSAAAAADPRIEFVGFVGPVERRDLLAWTDVLCLPSGHDEGLPYAVLEAASSGCALVTSLKGALGTVTVDGVTGRVVPPRDARAVREALEALDDDRDRLDDMQKRAHALVSQCFGIETMRTVFSTIWQRALVEGGSG